MKIRDEKNTRTVLVVEGLGYWGGRRVPRDGKPVSDVCGYSREGWVNQDCEFSSETEAIIAANAWRDARGYRANVLRVLVEYVEPVESWKYTHTESVVYTADLPPVERDMTPFCGSKKEAVERLWDDAHPLRDDIGNGKDYLGKPTPGRIKVGEAVAIYGKRVVVAAMNAGRVFGEREGDACTFDYAETAPNMRLYANGVTIG